MSWLASVLVALLMLAGAAGWAGPGTERGPMAAGVLIAGSVVVFAAAVVVVFRAARRHVADPATRILVILGFGALEMITFALMAFVSLLAFDR